MGRNKILIALVAAVAVTGGGAAIGSVDSGVGVSDMPNASNAVPAVDGPDAAQRSLVGALNRPASPVDLPAPEVVTPAILNGGAQRDAARLVATPTATSAGPDKVYLVPASRGLCVASVSYLYAGCTRDGDIAGGDFQAVTCSPFLDRDKLLLYAVMPNGVRSVTLVRADNSHTDVAVRSNFVSAAWGKDASPLTHVTWTDAAGQAHKASPMPPDAASDTCSDAGGTPAHATTVTRDRYAKGNG